MRSRRMHGHLLVRGLLAGLVLAASCGRPGGPGQGRGVLVIAIDSLRADHVSAFGYDRPTTPALDALAAEGFSFTQAFTNAPLLLPAHVGLLTGCEPAVARRFLPTEFEGLDERRWKIPQRVPRLAIEMLAAGYATAAFADHPLLEPVYGFDAGFQHYQILAEDSAQDWEGTQSARLSERLIQWVRSLERDRSWFAYLHLHDLERAWTTPRPEWETYFTPRPELSEVPPVGNTDSTFFTIPRSRWRGSSRSLGHYEAAYDGHLLALDHELERLFAGLRRAGRYENATILVVGSYGVQFGEAGLYLRAGRYSMADLHVPWIVRLPGRAKSGRSDALVSLTDLAPTVLELEGLSVPVGMHGFSLASLLRGEPSEVPPRRYAFASCGMQEGCAVIGERYCLEYLIPAGTEDHQIKRSWFGHLRESSLEPTPRFYDRRSHPFPPLASNHLGPPEEEAQFTRVARDWMRDINNARILLQSTALVDSRLDETTVRDLQEKGFVGKFR